MMISINRNGEIQVAAEDDEAFACAVCDFGCERCIGLPWCVCYGGCALPNSEIGCSKRQCAKLRVCVERVQQVWAEAGNTPNPIQLEPKRRGIM